MFKEPKQFPHVRSLNHKFPLILGARPVNIRPSKSSFMHKKVIEKLVKEMLYRGLFQNSYSLFASPVLLVKK